MSKYPGNSFGSRNIDDDDQPRFGPYTTNVVEYDWRDENGVLLYQTKKGLNPDGEKPYLVRRPNLLRFGDRIEPEDRVDWYYGLGDVRRILFNLPAIADPARRSETVWIVEGEKDATNLIRRGLVATTSFGGAGKWNYFETVNDGKERKHPKKISRDYSYTLVDRDCVILPDNDMRGEMHGEQVWRSLRGKASRIRLLCLPGLAHKGDVSDWLAAGGTVKELQRLADTIAVEIRSAS
ncbi:MAG: hypothetical protein E5Y65_26055 [Mesorhizobium sp.]|uniref:hypothetical protein n=1 Tax=Mesorhizobium sp. TaxID=1871066 RepID=UPI0011FE7219|nr:hypothetical protein [Mesorhizobium sp.]TIL86613.1 MAG: hypothetical protein E5Y65_26055 [Mesorhizobium sp.]TIL98386.1 MAG: hypothetical protein E5Y64_26465 [Mesorhizobium sp.]